MHVRRGEVYHNLFPRYSETHGLQGCNCPQEAFLDGGICEPYQMDTQTGGDVDFYCDGYGFYAYTFCAMDIYQHGHEIWTTNLAMKIENEVKKKKNIYLRNANFFFAC